jgi:hypothetical protein
MFHKAALFAAGLLIGIVVSVASTHFFLRHHIFNKRFVPKTEGTSGVLRPRMTMSEVELLFGQPDHIDVVDGRINGKYEEPKQIIWTYSRYKITESGENYSKPGHIRFIPVRFMHPDWREDDKIARQYGEQSNSFRTCSFRGSFPIRTEDWAGEDFGLLDGYRIKELGK